MRQEDPQHLIYARQTAAEILAAAAVELFPDIHLCQGQGTSQLFFYDFAFPFPFQPEMLSHLEERMRQIVKRGDIVKILDMVPNNAATLLEHRGQTLLAEKVRGSGQSLVRMVQIGSCIDWCEEAFSTKLDPQYSFKLIECFPIYGLTRIVGVLEPEKQALKKTLKQILPCAERDHQRLVEEFDLLMPIEGGLWSWLPKGDQIKHSLIQWWRREHLQQNFQLMTTPQPVSHLLNTHCDYWKKQGRSLKLAEISYAQKDDFTDLKNGLFESAEWISDRAHLFVTDEELFQECISSLQFIIKIPKILGFEFQTILYTGNARAQKTKALRLLQEILKEARLGYMTIQDPKVESQPCIQLQIPDSLGRWWDGPFLRIDGSVNVKAGTTCIVRSAFNSLERFVALCVEKNSGRWPFWLSPEQVRIIAVSSTCEGFVQSIRNQLQRAGIRVGVDQQVGPLKTRLHQSLAEQIPFVLLIGEQELKSSCVSFRTPESSLCEVMEVGDFVNRMIELNGSKDSELKN